MASKDGNAPGRPGSDGQIKTPKGTRDWFGQGLLLRDHILQTIGDILRRHGGIPLDTPVFELRHILSEKYGEDSRLIYNLEDQGGELCSLRYDLTVPFARWLAMHKDTTQIKRYQIAKVYRRDQPAIARGRLREFYQCDFDIAGTYDAMIPDAEVLRVIVEVFQAFKLDVTIKLNHRRILDGLFAASGVPEDKMRPVSSAVDKLDKLPWTEIRKEMVEEKGISADVADEVGKYVRRSGNMHEMIETLKSDQGLAANDNIKAGLDDLSLLLSYLEPLEVSDKVCFDLSLARGLDYYTGLIYEVIPNVSGIQVGSIAAGGRYDDLVGMYGKQPIPCIGVSFGIDRIYTLLDTSQSKKSGSGLARETDVYIVALGSKGTDGLIHERLRVARELWDAGIQTEFTAKVKPRVDQQSNASKNSLVVVILDENELESGQVRLKVVSDNDKDTTQKDRRELVRREDLVIEVQKRTSTLAVRPKW